MNRSLRRAHRRITTGLAVLVPPLFLFALLARRDWSTTPAFPQAIGVDRALADALDGLAVQTGTDGTAFRLARLGPDVVLAWHGSGAPGVLAYWTATAGAIEALPDDAVLLGPVDVEPRRFCVPAGEGQVVLYALGHGAVVGHAAPESR
jgi:hypothetical protein